MRRKCGAEGSGLHRLPEVDPQAPLWDLRFLDRSESYFFFAGFTDWLGFFGLSFSITKSFPHFGQRLEDNAIVSITVGMVSDARQCGHCICFSVNGSLMTPRAPGIELY